MPPSIRATSPGAVDALALEDLEAAGGGGADCIGGALSCGRRSSFSYHRLPDPRLRLTVRKLDGSFFDVEIARSAAVWELKVAIEELFFTLFDDTDKTISWYGTCASPPTNAPPRYLPRCDRTCDAQYCYPELLDCDFATTKWCFTVMDLDLLRQHVWSHFCLCFKDEKMTDDKATLHFKGNSGCHDDMPFVCSEYHSPAVTVKSVRLDNQMQHIRRFQLLLFLVVFVSSRSTTWLDDFNKDEGEKFIYSRCSTSVLEDLCIEEYSEERVEEERRKKRSLFHGWFSFSKFRSNRRTHAEDTVTLSCEKKNTGMRSLSELLMASASSAGPGPRDGEHRQVGRGEAAAAAMTVQRPGALRRAQSVAAEKHEQHRNHHTDVQPRRPEGHGPRLLTSCYLDDGDRCTMQEDGD
ncbi:hypothetical protein HU200_000355 [Digitaria exilis]|uniref:SNRNP25 ubiquitin-like domain-containing protein n=1 Tax=Digitaria exilis TaxID=1010633 RepID=A0A835G2Q8_9POAL|nr:hypothetical protein HU200_000355 [Digitaria exilis]